jgi:hypothetical protein
MLSFHLYDLHEYVETESESGTAERSDKKGLTGKRHLYDKIFWNMETFATLSEVVVT